MPKEYIKNIRYKLAENVTFWQNQLKLYFHEKLLPKYKSIKTRIGKKMENIDWEEVKNALDDLSDWLDNLKDLKDEINKHENSDNIETISTDVDGIIQIRENIIERFPDIEHIDWEHMDWWDMQIWHWENFIDPYQEDIGFDLYSYPDNIWDEFGLAA